MVEAIRLPFNILDTPQWLDGKQGEPFGHPNVLFRREGKLIVEAIIPTLEGTMTANEGDWIIRGVSGELYPCKPDIFVRTYELV